MEKSVEATAPVVCVRAKKASALRTAWDQASHRALSDHVVCLMMTPPAPKPASVVRISVTATSMPCAISAANATHSETLFVVLVEDAVRGLALVLMPTTAARACVKAAHATRVAATVMTTAWPPPVSAVSIDAASPAGHRANSNTSAAADRLPPGLVTSVRPAFVWSA